MSNDTRHEPRIYLGLFESKWAAIFFGVGMTLFAVGTIVRVLA